MCLHYSRIRFDIFLHTHSYSAAAFFSFLWLTLLLAIAGTLTWLDLEWLNLTCYLHWPFIYEVGQNVLHCVTSIEDEDHGLKV